MDITITGQIAEIKNENGGKKIKIETYKKKDGSMNFFNVFLSDEKEFNLKKYDYVDAVCFIYTNEKEFTNIICKRIYKQG